MSNFRTKVFKQTYGLVQVTGKAFIVCLSKMWAIYRLFKHKKNETGSFPMGRQTRACGREKGH